MNVQDQQRVVEALQALTGGLTVTEQDTLDSHARLQSRLGPPSPRRRLVVLSAVAAAVVVAGLVAVWVVDRDDKAGPQPTTPPDTPAQTLATALQSEAYFVEDADFLSGDVPTRATLAGLWLLRAPYDPASLVVDGDGDWSMNALLDAGLGGSSTLVGNTWTRLVADGPDCGDQGSLPWRAALAADGSLHLQYLGATNSCTPADYREVWDRVGPGSPIAEYLVGAAADAEWQQPTTWNWQGVYIAPRTGAVLEFDSAGHYAFYEDLTSRELVASDHGMRDTTADAGTLSATCTGGRFDGIFQVGEAPEVEKYVAATLLVRITTTQDGCASGVADQGFWMKVRS